MTIGIKFHFLLKRTKKIRSNQNLRDISGKAEKNPRKCRSTKFESSNRQLLTEQYLMLTEMTELFPKIGDLHTRVHFNVTAASILSSVEHFFGHFVFVAISQHKTSFFVRPWYFFTCSKEQHDVFWIVLFSVFLLLSP